MDGGYLKEGWGALLPWTTLHGSSWRAELGPVLSLEASSESRLGLGLRGSVPDLGPSSLSS